MAGGSGTLPSDFAASSGTYHQVHSKEHGLEAISQVLALDSQLGCEALFADWTSGSDEQFERLVRGDCDAVVTAMDNVFAWNRRAGPGDFCIVAQIERTTPLVVMAALLAVSLLMTPSLTRYVAERRFAQLQRKQGGSFCRPS